MNLLRDLGTRHFEFSTHGFPHVISLAVFFTGFEFDRLNSVPSLGPQFPFGTMRGRVYDCLEKFVITRSLDGLWSYNSSWQVLGIESGTGDGARKHRTPMARTLTFRPEPLTKPTSPYPKYFR